MTSICSAVMPRSPALCLTWYGMPSINSVLRTNQALTVLVWQTRVTSERIVQVGRLVQGSTRAVNTPVRSELHIYAVWPLAGQHAHGTRFSITINHYRRPAMIVRLLTD